jgi:hypothetical protein
VEADEFDRSFAFASQYCLHHVNGCGSFRYGTSDAIEESFVEFAIK